VEASSRTDDDRLFPSQQNSQAFALHRRVKAADDWHAGFTQALREVVRLEDQSTRALDRANQRERFTLQVIKIPENGDPFWGLVAEVLE